MHDYFCYMMPLIYTPDREYVHIFRENMEIDFPRLPLISQTEKNATLLFLLSTLPPLSFLLPPLIIIISLFSIFMIFHIIICL